MPQAENSAAFEAAESAQQVFDVLQRDVEDALARGDVDTVNGLLEGLHAADKAELLNYLPEKDRCELTGMLGEAFDADILPELSSDAAEHVMEALGTERCAEALAQMESDDALHLIEELDEAGQAELLGAVPEALRDEIEEALCYPEDSAGRLMTRKLVAVADFWTVGNVIDYLRSHVDLPENFYLVYVVDARFHPIGRVHLGKMLHAQRDVKIAEIMQSEQHQVATDLDQEEVAHLFTKYGLVETPVVNAGGRLMGTITVDDVVHVIHEEEGEDYLRSGGVKSQDIQMTLFDTMKQRFPWLFVNLLTAVLASLVIGAYAETIEQLVALAVLMPIVASMGGNAGTQSVTVAVRALATKELRGGKGWAAIRKELMVGLMNGALLAVLMAAGAFLMYHDGMLAAVFGFATILTLMIAGFSGAAIPIVLSRLKVDPAIASGVFLTTVTDVVGFLSFLGLAALLLMG
jgi:magnesium transporter